MPAIRLATRRVEKPWGRHALWPGFADVAPGGEPVGEIWFEDPRSGRGEPALLIKYLFTAEKLSVQVHPDDRAARAMGKPCGKDEAWVVLAAERGATIGIGLRETLTADALRAAALDGSIEALVDWRVVAPDDSYYSPAGTIHAIGPGVTLVEVQQYCDTTFRLYDYGRPRELHLDDAIAVADPVPYLAPHVARALAPGRTLLCDGPKFVLERWTGAHDATLSADAGPFWIVPLAGVTRSGDARLLAGSTWLVEDGGALSSDADADVLIAYGGADVITI